MNTISMPDRLVPALSISCGLLTATYLTLMITTIFFATWQSQAVSTLRDTQSNIGNLETQYYSAINKVTSQNPGSLGFVTPTDVEYVAASNDKASNLSFAGK